MWLYYCVRLVISNMVYLCCDGTEKAADRAYRRHKIPDWWMDRTTIERSYPVGERSEVSDSRSWQQICYTLFSSGNELRHPRVEDAVSNATSEWILRKRFMGSLRRECMDHILIHGENHLRRVVTEYTAYFNQERPHQGIDQRVPKHYDLPKSKPTRGQISSKAILGGLHHSYSRTLHLN